MELWNVIRSELNLARQDPMAIQNFHGIFTDEFWPLNFALILQNYFRK